MKKSVYLMFYAFLATHFVANAQNGEWRDAPLDENSNFFEIVKENQKRISGLTSRRDVKSRKEVKQFNRWVNYWQDRVSEDGSFLPASHNYNEWLKDNKKQEELRKRLVSNDGEWNLVGPSTPPVSSTSYYPGMGRLNTIAVNPNNQDIMYVGSPGGGVWKTTDGGASWSPKGDKFPNMGVSDIVIDPTNVNIMYLATGDWDGRHNLSVGVLKSTDAGETWNTTGLTFSRNNMISHLLIDPNNTNTVFATTTNSIKRSTDGGVTWTDVYTEIGAIFNDIEYKTGSNSTIYATSKRGSFYISRDNGENWEVISIPGEGRVDIAQTTDDSNLILLLDQRGNVSKSTDEGLNWEKISTIRSYQAQGSYNMTIAISPVNKNLVLVGGVEGWRSTDGGTTWEKYLDGYWTRNKKYFYVHSDHHDMQFLPNTNIAFSLNDGGIFKGDASRDIKWTDLSSGLAITQYYNVSGTPQNSNKLIAGAQDNDVAVYDGDAWRGKNPGTDGVEGLWDYSDSNIAYTCSQSGMMYRTTDGFVTQSYIPNPAVASFVWKLEIDPTVPSTIYGGYSDIYKSTNRGDTWTNLKSGVGSIKCIAIAPSNSNIIYVSGTNGIKKTVNGGTSWTSINSPSRQSIKGIAINPANTDEVYICFAGYSLEGKVFKSTNGGADWRNITGDLPNVPTHDIDFKTGSTKGELFLATDLGVYYRTNVEQEWLKLNKGLPNVIVHDLEIHYDTEKIRVATFGRGVWERSIAETSLGLEEAAEVLPANLVEVYPNPAKDKIFNISLSNLLGDTNVCIYNIIGGVVKNFKTSKKEVKVDLSNYAKGLYLVKITNGDKEITKKIIVE